MRPNIWFKVLPSDDDKNDISTAINLDWDDIMSMVLNCKLLNKMKVQGKHNYMLNQGNLRSFYSTLDGDMPLVLSDYYDRIIKKGIGIYVMEISRPIKIQDNK